MEIVDYALMPARFGLRVFPVVPNSKVPAIAMYQHRATTDEYTIRRWWSEQPYNIGVVADNRVFVDLDIYKNPDIELQALELGINPYTTVSQDTPHGGIHCLYQFDRPMGSTTGLEFPGLDIRAGTGYILWAGSSIDGKFYKLRTAMLEVLPPVPPLLASKLKPQGSREAVPGAGENVELDLQSNITKYGEFLANFPPAIQGQSGDTQTYKAAAEGVRDFALTEHTAFTMLWDFYNPKCVPPWDYEELKKKVYNAAKHGRHPVGFQSAFQLFNQNTIPASAGNLSADVSSPLADWIVPDVLARGEVTLLSGASGLGKSTLVSTFIAHLMAGESFGPFRIAKPVAVMTLNDEDTIKLQSRRIRAVFAYHKWALDHGVERNIMVLTGDDLNNQMMALAGMNHTVTANRNVDALVARWMQQMPYTDVVVLDPLMNLHEANENDNAQMNHVMRIIRDTIARRYNVAVLLNTHTGKDPSKATTARGASSIEGVPRINFTLTKDRSRPTFTLSQTKMTFGPEIPSYELTRKSMALRERGETYPLFMFDTTTSDAMTRERNLVLGALVSYMDKSGITTITQSDASIALSELQSEFSVSTLRSKKLRDWLATNFVYDGTNVLGKPIRAWLTLGEGGKITLRHM